MSNNKEVVRGKPVAYYMNDIYTIAPVVGGQVVCKIIGHPRQSEFESTCQVTSKIMWVSPSGGEFETYNTYYKPYRNFND